MNTVQIITRSVRIDKSLLRLVTIRGIGQSSPNLGVKTKRKKSRNDECTEISWYNYKIYFGPKNKFLPLLGISRFPHAHTI